MTVSIFSKQEHKCKEGTLLGRVIVAATFENLVRLPVGITSSVKRLGESPHSQLPFVELIL